MEILKISVIAAIICLHANLADARNIDAQCTTQQHRLRFHFSPRENWSNDPNGMVYYDGLYHLFFQHHPYSTQWGDMHWGHAISRNLVTWEQLEIALYPDPVGTIFSGSAVVDFTNTTGFQQSADVPPVVAIYTSSGDRQRQSLAFSIDKGMTYAKYEGNPVLGSQDDAPDFRDPKVFMDEKTGKWVMVLAVGNRIEFYGSADLKSWEKLSEFGRDPEEGNHGGVWECPDMVELADQNGEKRWVLIISTGGGGPNGGTGTHYIVGNWDGTRFNSFGWQPNQVMDWGPDNYAGVTWSNDPQGRSLWLGWMSNGHYAGAIPTSTWRGQFTIPRHLTLHAVDAEANNYRVKQNPPQEFESLRNPLQHIELSQEFTVLPHSVVPLTDQAQFKNPLLEISVTLEMRNNPEFSLCVNNALEEEVCFGFNADRRWFLDRRRSGSIEFHDLFRDASYSTAPREVTNEEVTIKMMVDTSSIEVFADDGLTVMTGLFFPTETLDRVYIYHGSREDSDATLKVKKLDIWGLVCSVQ